MACSPCNQDCHPSSETDPASFSGADIDSSTITNSTIQGSSVSGLPDPSGPTDATTKSYVDSLSVDSIAELKLVDTTEASPGYANVLGYHAPGGLGGGLFWFDSASAATANDGTIVAPTVGTGRWVRVYTGPINVHWFGAKGDGASDDATAIQKAFDACPEFGEVELPSGTYVTGAQLEVNSSNLSISGPGKIQAKANTSFEYVLLVTSKANVHIEDVEFDANQASRVGVQAVRFMGAAFISCTDCSFVGCVSRNALGYSSVPAVGLTAAGNSTRCTIEGCRLIDNGTSSKAADGVFTSGTQNVISNCQAVNCTDTAFVIESSNYSIISGCTSDNCSAVAAITNATADTKRGNVINGLTGRNWDASGTGGIQIGVPGAYAGNLADTLVTNVVMYADVGSGYGTGAAINIRNTGSGRAVGVLISGVRIKNSQNQAILVDGDDVSIIGAHIIDNTDAAVQFQTGCTRGVVDSCSLYGGLYAVITQGTASAIARNCTCVSNTTAFYAFDTSSLQSYNNTITSAGTTYAKDVGATIKRLDYPDWTAWTPTYSSDLGNAATTFSGSVTTTLARYTLVGKICHVTVNFSATLNAVTPANLQLTLPTSVVPANDNTYAAAMVNNAGTQEPGFVRTLTGTNVLVFYRNGLAAFGSGAAVGGRVSFSFEISAP